MLIDDNDFELSSSDDNDSLLFNNFFATFDRSVSLTHQFQWREQGGSLLHINDDFH